MKGLVGWLAVGAQKVLQKTRHVGVQKVLQKTRHVGGGCFRGRTWHQGPPNKQASNKVAK